MLRPNGESGLEHEPLLKARRGAVRENEPEQVEFRVTGGVEGGRVPGQDQLRKLNLVDFDRAYLIAQFDGPGSLVLGARAGRHGSERSRDDLLGRLRVEVSGDDEGCVRGHVEASEEGHDVLHCCRLQVLVAADDRVVVGVIGRVEQRR